MLQAYLGVVRPEGIRSVMDLTKGIHKWEADVASLKNRFNEGISERVKSATLIGMIPKEYQDMVLQKFALTAEFQFSEIRDYVVNVATNRVQMNTPKPHVGSLEGLWGYEPYPQQEEWEGYENDLATARAKAVLRLWPVGPHRGQLPQG